MPVGEVVSWTPVVYKGFPSESFSVTSFETMLFPLLSVPLLKVIECVGFPRYHLSELPEATARGEASGSVSMSGLKPAASIMSRLSASGISARTAATSQALWPIPIGASEPIVGPCEKASINSSKCSPKKRRKFMANMKMPDSGEASIFMLTESAEASASFASCGILLNMSLKAAMDP